MSALSRKHRLEIWTLVFTAMGIPVALFYPEIRTWLRLEGTPAASAPQSSAKESDLRAALGKVELRRAPTSNPVVASDHSQAPPPLPEAEAGGRPRETYVNETILASNGQADSVILAVKVAPADSQGDAFQGLLARLLTGKGRRPVSGAFKAAFYADALFDKLWSGDQSVVDRLRLLDAGRGCILLCKPSLSEASKTDFDAIVSVQGAVSLILVTKEARKGPWVFNASGAGGNRAEAAANCVKHLAEVIDVDAMFQK